MTGYGEAQARWRNGNIKVTVRSVNHKFFSLKLNLPDILNDYESEIEQGIRRYINRGVVHMSIRVDAPNVIKPFRLNTRVLDNYYRELKKLQRVWRNNEPIRLEMLLNLPHVIEPQAAEITVQPQLWKEVQKVIRKALLNLRAMRQREAQRLKLSLDKGLRCMAQLVKKIAQRTPRVMEQYQKQLEKRINQLVGKTPINLNNQPALITELVGLAQRCAINEELTRLESHLNEFRNSLNRPEEIGKRLDFIAQEMLRETNTLGAKANDTQVIHWAIDLKNEIDKLKEQVQNIE